MNTKLGKTLLLAPTLLLALAACGSQGGGSSVAATTAAANNDMAVNEGGPGVGAPRELANNAAGAAKDASGYQSPASLRQPAIISTGSVSLESKDVGQLRFDVQKAVDQNNGQITDENTETDNHGAVVRSRLVVRVPSADFGQTMSDLEKTGQLISSTRKSQDVTTRVIDTAARVKAQQASVRRIRLLLGHANSINEIMSIESELTQRTADLDSLRQQQTYLADQTSYATITVSLQKLTVLVPPKPAHPKQHTGFLAGLHRGWSGLADFGNGLATVVGLLLPVGILLLLLGWPIAWAVRRWRPFTQSRTARTPSAP